MFGPRGIFISLIVLMVSAIFLPLRPAAAGPWGSAGRVISSSTDLTLPQPSACANEDRCAFLVPFTTKEQP